MKRVGFVALAVTLVALGAAHAATPPEAKPRPRPKAPLFDGTTLEGKTVSLASFRGRPLFVNVWSSL